MSRPARWQVQEAEQRFSELLRSAQDDGPQLVTKHGQAVAVLVDIAEYRRLTGRDDGYDFKDWLLSGPLVEDFEVERDRRPARDVDLGDVG